MLLTRPEQLRIDLPLTQIAQICVDFGVSELAVFGSALRDDFDPSRSDIDFLVRFENNDAGPWMQKFAGLEEAFGRLLGCKVDVVDWNGVEQSTNPYRKAHILKHARRVYIA